jgi:hypothetical protein
LETLKTPARWKIKGANLRLGDVVSYEQEYVRLTADTLEGPAIKWELKAQVGIGVVVGVRVLRDGISMHKREGKALRFVQKGYTRALLVAKNQKSMAFIPFPLRD